MADYGQINTSLCPEGMNATLFELSKDLERAHQPMDLPPLQRVIAINRLAPATREYRRQRILSPVASVGQSDRPSGHDSDDEWNRKEDARERRLRERQ